MDDKRQTKVAVNRHAWKQQATQAEAEDARKILHPELELPVLPLSDDERIKVVAAAIRSAVDQRTRKCWLCCVGPGTREQAANEIRDKWPEVFSPPSISAVKNQGDYPITQNHLKDALLISAAPELYEACRIACEFYDAVMSGDVSDVPPLWMRTQLYLALAKARGEA